MIPQKQRIAERRASHFARRAQLSDEKLNLLEKRLRGQVAETGEATNIPRRAIPSPAPLSFAQQRLWFLDQLEPGNPFYNIPIALCLTGRLSMTALEQSLNEMIRRHETLRTTFATVGDQPMQVVAPSLTMSLPLVDLTSLPESEREIKVRRLVAEDANRPFDLAHGPLLRVTLIQQAKDTYTWLVNTHHIISDGWSASIFIREMVMLYQAFANGWPSPLPEPAIQYADFAIWQRQWLQGEILKTQLAYWKGQLGGDLPVIELPTDRPRPPIQTFQGAIDSFSLPLALSEALRALSTQEGSTLFMTLLAAFQTLLHRYAGQEDVIVGSPIANRNRLDTKELIGFFVNTLALRTDLSGNPTFQQLLAQVREGTLGAYAHQDVPFERLVEKLQPERDMSRSPLFQVMLVLQNPPRSSLTLPGFTLSPLEIDSQVAKFDLTLGIVDAEQGLSGTLGYNTDLFDAATVARILAHFETLLESIVADPQQRLADLALLDKAERQQLLATWNDTQAAYPPDRCLHDLVETQIVQTPDAVAIALEDGQLTYRALSRKANQLAHHLQGLGVGPEALVGVCVERSLEMIVGILGVLKAGGAYVPLDPAYPQERLAFMLQDAQVTVLLTQKKLLPELPQCKTCLVRLDTDWPAIVRRSEANPSSGVSADNPAYVIYTSGSTGRPKGVVVSHRAVCNHLLWRQAAYPLSSTDVFPHKASLSFDLSIWEIWGMLTAGVRLVLARPGGQMDAVYLARLVVKESITIIHFPPVMLRVFLEEPEARHCTGLRRVFCGGEPLTQDIAARFFDRLNASLHHQYGPTEACVVSAVWNCARHGRHDVIPIGRAIANTQIHILDRHLRPTPVGIPGELHIGGTGLARGYLGQPRLTAERFIPDPFSQQPGDCLYKTGDLARYLPDGQLEFLGRIDHQVKVRGFRIELGEIEAVLSQHPAVQGTVVLAREDAPGDKRLVAYVVPEDTRAPTHRDLRDFLADKLPEYMVPAAFVTLEAFPLTPNGKINRRALPAPDRSSLQEAEFVPPRTPVEEVLAAIWAQTLNLERISVESNFFALGGHSLLATQVISRLRQALQVEMPLRSLFEAPTVASLATRIQAARRAEQGWQAPPILPAPRDALLPLSFAQQRLWFLDQLEPDSPFYNILAPLRLTGPLNVAALAQSLNEMVRRHETLRTTFALTDGQPIQLIAPHLHLPLPIVDLRGLPQPERQAAARQLATQEALRPFDLIHGPLLRVTLLQLDEETWVLLTNMHHIISDGWSVGILIREMAALYQAFIHSQPSPLPDLAVQYADFALWQREWLQGQVLDQQLTYWQTQLAGELPVLELPTDRPRPPVQTFRGDTFTFTLSSELSAGLKAISRRQGVTLFMTLLAGFQTLLQRYTAQDDFIVGSPIANRHYLETEGLIGFLINTLALRSDLSGDPGFDQLLERVREATLGAYAHQDLPFERLVEALQPQRDLSRTPLFQVMFALQNAPRTALALSDVTLSPVEMDGGVAKFDLTLAVTEVSSGLSGAVEYNTDLFDAATVARLAGHLETLLSGAVADAGQRLSALPLLGQAERQQLLAEWNDTQRACEQQECVQVLFAAQVARTPDAVALVFAGAALTYGALNRRANQLAHHLQGLGIGPDVTVAICIERSLDMMVGILGILKAGGAYLPLDPAYPPERLAFVLDDTQATVLLTQQPLTRNLPEHAACAICLDSDWPAIAQEHAENPVSEATIDNLAYVIYTSGSTGKPKGVQIEHRGLLNLIAWHQRAFSVSPADRATQIASPAFDASVWELWPYLVAGVSIHIPDETTRAEPVKLKDWLVEQAITISFLPTPLAERILSFDWPQPSALRVLLTGGDKLHHHPSSVLPFAFVNNYGPTENTVVTTSGLVPSQGETGQAPAIGRPIGNTKVYLLDGHLQPVPVGIPGELYLGGNSLGRGYLKRPELTAQAFIAHPFSTEQGARLYRTGDLVRYLSDGRIEFLGRVDHQVKVRGFRIELGEIEAVLSSHPAVRETAVVARQDRPGNKQLAAYVVFQKGEAPATNELRRFLKDKLPDYMIPSAFVTLASLPLTPNGKVDRRALPEPDGLGERSLIAPRTPIEEALVGMWADVLGLEQLSIYDNFFALGGHSLLATQVISRLRQAFQVEMPLRSLFEAPTVASLATRIQAARRAEQGWQAPPILPAPRDALLPLSFAQQRLWFLDQLEPDSPFYNILAPLRLTGPLNVAALAQSLNEMVRRHETLRTTFALTDGQPIQLIAPHLHLSLPIVDLRGLPQPERQAAARQLATQEALRPFDLNHGPLLRVTLLQLDEQTCVLLTNMHHIISDGWSVGILIREMAALYQAFTHSQPSPLPDLAVQYADFALWQREWLQGQVLDQQLAYWQTQLAGELPVLELPTDRPRPPVQTFRGDTFTFTLSPELTAGLKALSRRQGVTLFMTLLAGFQTLLQRYTAQDDFIVGSPIANRHYLETEGLIGFFVNTLALRGDLSGDPSFDQLLERVREATLGAYAHQDLPFERLVEALQPQRDLSRTPLFQVMFALQNAPRTALALSDVTLSPVEMDGGVAKFDLTLAITDSEQELAGAWTYNTDLFDAATVARLAGHLETLLAGAAADAGQQLSALPLLGLTERQQLLVEWNDTQRACEQQECVQVLFAAQVARTPDAVALVFAGAALTYRALNRRANQLAHHLQALGVGPDTLVGICVERSLDMVVGLLGVLKAGGAYLPLDPTYPPERLAFIRQDAQLALLLTQASLAESLGESQARTVCLDGDWAPISRQSEENPVSRATADNLAYVIYTSGSTGRPKGVAIAHRSAVAMLDWSREVFPPADRAGVLASTSICFDLSVFELFVPLSWGGRVILAENALQLPGLTAAQEVTLVNTVPSAMAELVRLKGLPPSVRTVNLAGEPLPRQLVDQLYQCEHIAGVFNLYGPSEDTTYSTFALIQKDSPRTPAIGRPVSHSQMYLLAGQGELAPPGVPGELYIGGAGLARGYLARPELTAERFLPDPFGGEPGGRLYETGDLARYLPDGQLEFLGRTDHQVKIRGFRIELGEVESMLGQHPAVCEAVVLAREDEPGDKRLVAYLVPGQAQTPTVGELRGFLKARLPEYMLPSAFVTLEALPLTPNGKIDRRALPAPEASQVEGETWVGPRDALEWQLVQIWQDLLNVRPVGVTHNFFELGGHSLLAVRLVTRIQQATGQTVPLTALFHSPTVEQLAVALRRQRQGVTPPSSPLVPLQSGQAGRRPLFLVHPVGGHVLCYAELVRHLDAAQPCYGLQARGLEDGQSPHTSLEDMAAEYLSLVRGVQAEGPYLLGGWSLGGVVAYEMAQQLTAQGQEVALLALIDSPAPDGSQQQERDELALLAGFALDLGLPIERLAVEGEALAQVAAEERLAWLMERARAVGVLPPDVALAQVEQLFAVFRGNLQALAAYRPPAYDGDVTLFRAEERPGTRSLAEDLGWGALVRGALQVHAAPGNHYTLLRPPHVQALARPLREHLQITEKEQG